VRSLAFALVLVTLAGGAAACGAGTGRDPTGGRSGPTNGVGPGSPGVASSGPVTAPSASAPSTSGPASTTPVPTTPTRRYPQHSSVVATTFWVGEIFDPTAADGSQVVSTYDDSWLRHYGGCDGVVVDRECRTERRTAADHFFPTAMRPEQNPFYLDLPFDDVNNAAAAAQRGSVVPWAHDPGWVEKLADPHRSIMKNRWVAVRKGSHVCYGQIEDAGPGEYDDVPYVFGSSDARPRNQRYNGAGMDVSPALNGCLGFAELDGEDDRVDWWFVDASDVPAGPWRILVTTR
jgi:hypothetical protein